MQIFVAHDFSKPPLWNYRKPFSLVAREYKIAFKFADDIHEGEHLLDQIEELIRESHYSLFDVSTPNPNVFLELGFARGLGRNYSLLFRPAGLLHHLGFTTRLPSLPADISGLRLIKYHNAGILRVRLVELIKELSPNLRTEEDKWIAWIDEVLRRHPDGLLMREIAKELNVESADSVRGFVQKMVRSGLVEQKGSGPATRYLKSKEPKRAA
jgi:hypothetical protein